MAAGPTGLAPHLLVEPIRTADGPRLSEQTRWCRTVEVLSEHGESRHLKLMHRVRLERTRRYGGCFLGMESDSPRNSGGRLYDPTSSYVEGAAEKNPMIRCGYPRDHRPDSKQVVIAPISNSEGFPLSYETFDEPLWKQFRT